MNEHTEIIAQLADRAAERLSPAEEARLNCHLENCPPCREQARRFTESFQALAKVLDEVQAPPLLNGVLARLDHPEARRASFGWRPAWAGGAVLALVLVFSALMSRPGITTQQVLQDYSEDVQTLWEGGAAQTDGAWLPEGWSETTGLETSETNLENII
jgi:anti-sigma factor RsiW